MCKIVNGLRISEKTLYQKTNECARNGISQIQNRDTDAIIIKIILNYDRSISL